MEFRKLGIIGNMDTAEGMRKVRLGKVVCAVLEAGNSCRNNIFHLSRTEQIAIGCKISDSLASRGRGVEGISLLY